MQTFSTVLCGLLLGGIVLCFYYLLRERSDTKAAADVDYDDLGYLEKICPTTDFEDSND